MVAEIIRLQLQASENLFGRYRTVVRQNNDMLAVKGDRIAARGINNAWAIMAELLLKSCVAVISISPRLLDGKLVHKSRARCDTGKAEAGDAIHVGRKQNPVPENGAALLQLRYRSWRPQRAPGRLRIKPSAKGKRRKAEHARTGFAHGTYITSGNILTIAPVHHSLRYTAGGGASNGVAPISNYNCDG